MPLEEITPKINRLGSIKHPNLLPIHDVIIDNLRQLVVVEEHCPEGNIGKCLGNLAQPVVTLIEQLVLGIDYLHTHKRMMHGGLCP